MEGELVSDGVIGSDAVGPGRFVVVISKDLEPDNDAVSLGEGDPLGVLVALLDVAVGDVDGDGEADDVLE